MANADEIKLLIEARNEYVKLIKQEMLGPGSEISIPDEEHELITSCLLYTSYCGYCFNKVS